MGIGIGVAVFGLIISLISAAIELITGILGVKYCDDASKAKTCMIWGIVVAVLCVIGHIITAVGGGDFGVFGLLCGLVIPVLYIIGAKKNMNSACAAPVCEEAPDPAEEIPPVSEPVAEENSSVEDTPTEE